MYEIVVLFRAYVSAEVLEIWVVGDLPEEGHPLVAGKAAVGIGVEAVGTWDVSFAHDKRVIR